MKSKRSGKYKWILTLQNNKKVLGSKIYVENTDLKTMAVMFQKT